MLKTGVYDVRQLRQGASFRSAFGGEKRLSITLYDQIADLPDAGALAERILRHFSDGRGAFKRTCANRSEDFDRLVLEALAHEFSGTQNLTIFDTGVSDARTSCNLFDALAPRFPACAFFATDYDPSVTVIEDGRVKITVGRAGELLEIVWPPFVFNVTQPESRVYYPLNHVIRRVAERLIARPLVKKHQAGQIGSRTIRLFCPDALAHSRTDARFHLGAHDLLAPFDGTADVIRAMNVLNPSYFSPPEVRTILTHIHNALRAGGVLITGSNQEAGSVVHGGLYRRTAAGFALLRTSGDGSPLRESIEGFQATAAPAPMNSQ